MGQKFHTLHTTGDDARTMLAKASHKIAQAIGTTLGPNGWNAALERDEGSPTITKDGATVMFDLSFDNKWETMMYEMYRDASDYISKHVGDGTTSVVILADSILQNGMRSYAAGHDIKDVVSGIRDAAETILSMIGQHCRRKDATEEVIRSVLEVAAAGDKSIVDRLTDIYMETGDSGMIIVKDSAASQDDHQFEDGYVVPIGTNNSELFEEEGKPPRPLLQWEQPYILVINDHIISFKQILPIMERVLLEGEVKKLIISYTRMDNDVIEAIRTNNLSDKNDLEVMAVKMPMYAERQTKLQEDLAAYVDAVIVDTKGSGVSIDSLSLNDLGRADQIVSTRFDMKILGGRGAVKTKPSGKTVLEERIDYVQQDRDKFTGNIQERMDADYRLARLKSSICCIYIGASSEAEAKRRKGVYEDCIRAVQAAVKDGVVPGGGWPMYFMSLNTSPDANQNPAYKYGYECLLKSIRAIFNKLCRDVETPAEFIAREIQETGDGPNASYNFSSRQAGDAVDIQVLEPYYLTREVLNQAVSIATTILTSDGTITRHSKGLQKSWKDKVQTMSHLRY